MGSNPILSARPSQGLFRAAGRSLFNPLWLCYATPHERVHP